MRTEDGTLFVGPDEGKALVNPIGGQMLIKIRDEDTSGAYSVHYNTIPPGSPGPRPHIHLDHVETFYVLEGELTLRAGEHTIKVPAGSFAVVPRGIVHQPSNSGAVPTGMLLIFSPAGMDSFFEEAVESHLPLQVEPTDPLVLEKLAAFSRKYSLEFAEFPPDS